MNNIYFITDAHLGSLAIPHGRQHERRLVHFLDQIKGHAQALYMLGDMFDFWYEYRHVVPRGYTRFLGKIAELTDAGVEVHLFVGNHDLWCTDYLTCECGVVVHRHPLTLELGDKLFYLAHGDGLGDTNRSFALLRRVFRNSLCRRLFSAIHPRWGVAFGREWARRSRQKHVDQGGEPPYQGEDGEPLVRFAKHYVEGHPDVNFFLFGHRHIELDLLLSRTTRVLILGDWIDKFTYAVWNGENLFMENYVEGETRLCSDLAPRR